MDILAQITGYLALTFTIIGFAAKEDRVLRIANFAGILMWCAHLALLSAWGSFFMMVLAALMVGSGLAGFPKWGLFFWRVNLVVLPAALILTLVGYLPWIAIVPVIGGFLINTAVTLMSGRSLTLMIAAGQVVWLLNGFMIGSLFIVATNVLGLAALVFRIWKQNRNSSLMNPT